MFFILLDSHGVHLFLWGLNLHFTDGKIEPDFGIFLILLNCFVPFGMAHHSVVLHICAQLEALVPVS